MSDLHYADDGPVLGHDPEARVQMAVDHVLAHYKDADCVVLSGDLVNHGSWPAYVALRKHLDRLGLRYYPLMGNHDLREPMLAALPVPEDRLDGFVQYQVTLPGLRLLCLDTHIPGEGDGELCAARLGWLRERLAEDATPAIVFMHHPPLDLGLPAQDETKLRNGAAFLDVIEGSAVVQLCMGHVHRPVCGVIRGVPFAVMKSVLLQAPAPRPAWGFDNFRTAPEPPALGVIEVSGRDVTVQFVEFCAAGDGVV